MKLAKRVIGILLWAGLAGGTVEAQGPTPSGPLLEPIRPIAFGDEDGSASGLAKEASSLSCSESAISACGAPCVSGSCCACGGAGCCDGCGAFQRWQARDPWKLPQPCLLQCLGIKTGGWLQFGMSMNAEDPGDRFNGPVLTNDRDREFQMNQLWLYFDRPCDTGGNGVDIGGRVDLTYGTDWRVAMAMGLGLDDKINGPDQYYGLAVPQFYLETAVNHLSVKIGRQLGILGYESVPPLSRFFYTASYSLCYTEPYIITGLMAKYQWGHHWVAQAGFHQGFFRFEDNNDNLNFQGGIKWHSCDRATSLAYAMDAGRNDPAGLQDQYVQSLVLQQKLTESVSYVIQSDLGFLNGVGGGQDAEWYSINQYLFYTINPRWSTGMRIEWFRDDDGVRIAGLGNFPAPGWLGPPGYAGNFTELTLGLNWKPKSNITVRPEVRWDWYDGPANPTGGGAFPLPFDGGNGSRQFLMATDVVITY